MNERVKTLYDALLKRDYRSNRSNIVIDYSKEFQDNNIPFPLRASEQLYRVAKLEKPLLTKEERIGFKRYIPTINEYVTEEEYNELNSKYFIFDRGVVGNISSNYADILNSGFEVKKQYILNRLETETEENKIIELKAMLQSIEAIYVIAENYKDAAKDNNIELYNALCVVPYNKPQSFYQALVFLRLLNFTLWLNRNKHCTLGRFDQYMYPFYKNDIENNLLTKDEALDLIEEFFISLNYDADLYPGVQQGDNGQSLVLGGVDKDGNNAFNELTDLALKASLELKLIDPKINLRVNSKTEDYWFELGTLLTKQGLGFPQYSNDDVVIPALVKLNYDLEDARDYVVAACWEFIIPGKAMDVVNVDAINFPSLVNDVVHNLNNINSYEEFEEQVNQKIQEDVLRMVTISDPLYIFPSPFQSLLMDGCLEKAKDISLGSKYNNYGFHGAGISNAADAMMAVKKVIFEEKSIDKETLLKALDNNFEGYNELRQKLLNVPKMGQNDDEVDNIATKIMDTYAKECSKHKNSRGGIIRAGTGTAMYYIWWSENLKATADGRKASEPFSANYSPSLNINMKGVLSVISSFTKPNLINICNGGPLTLEFHDSLFRNEEGCNKVAAMVKTYIKLKGHQLQLNAVNRETLLDAQKHPENHKNLIVRVWGWSGYFNELDIVYQNHIIKRLEFTN